MSVIYVFFLSKDQFDYMLVNLLAWCVYVENMGMHLFVLVF